jgi:hypothetical protein
MSEPALVGAIDAGGSFTARYLRWSGPPDVIVPTLRAIWVRTFGCDTAATVSALLGNDWSELCELCPHRGYDRAAVRVDGVGHAVPATDARPATRGRADTDARTNYHLEWLFLIDPATDQVLVYEATVHGRWLPHSRHPLDPDQPAAVLGCGGHATDGHHGVPAHVSPPTSAPGDGSERITYAAEVCTGPHPEGYVVARFDKDVAAQIVADTAQHSWGTWWPQLRYDGTEFDLVWSQGQEARLRVVRDIDGRLLIGAYLLPWRRVGPPPDRVPRW